MLLLILILNIAVIYLLLKGQGMIWHERR
jgi:hypothetical protein